MGDVVDATEVAIAAAKHLTDADRGAVEALRVLAGKIDTDDELRTIWLDYQANREVENMRPLQLDNVSIPTYLKYCESLGLTPAGRSKLGEKKEPQRGKLGNLSSVPRPA